MSTDSQSKDSTPTVSRYANERLEALYERVTTLEVAIVNAATCLQDQNEESAMTTLTTALVETFRGALLCGSETTDEQLDEWLPEIEKHDAEQAAESEAKS